MSLLIKGKNVIEIKDLTISFDDKTVLENINLNIRKGEITTIVGQSGCGKSVLMKTIEALITPQSGDVFIDGVELFSLSRKELNMTRRKVAMLFQGAALLDSLNVFQNVALPLKEHTQLSEAEINRLVDEKLDLVGLSGLHRAMPSELSGGMKKRVALARAIILQPEYIIYDEPTTGLDSIIAHEIIRLILKMHENYQVTSIIITHDLACISKLQGNIVMIHNKKIVFDGKYQEFINSNLKIIKNFIAV
ncbi:MAG: ABC transporter ATP-binding protein [Candidatus Cloacimonadales bacterium]|nr:ABC transporter ATP-binding protein [Candidatus Cloacimonadales bacterium]